MKKNKIKNQGFSVIEVVVGTAIVSMCILGLVFVAQVSVRVTEESNNNVKAAFLLEEGMEAVRTIRDENWSTLEVLTAGSSYYLHFNGSVWQATTTNNFIDGFERKFVLSDVYRDANQDIAAVGTVDASTTMVAINVAWSLRGATTTKSLSAFLTKTF